MTVRDWLPIVGALLIPVVIAAGSGWITWQQGKIADQRAKADQALAEQRAQDEALQACLDQMNTLLLEHNLRGSQEDSGVRTLARARTLTVLSRLDPSRKTQVMQFLDEAKLIGSVDGRDPIIELSDADLNGIALLGAHLEGAYLYNADLSGADLTDAQGITKEELKTVKSLEHATMPNGQKYEEWLKSREGAGG